MPSLVQRVKWGKYDLTVFQGFQIKFHRQDDYSHAITLFLGSVHFLFFKCLICCSALLNPTLQFTEAAHHCVLAAHHCVLAARPLLMACEVNAKTGKESKETQTTGESGRL